MAVKKTDFDKRIEEVRTEQLARVEKLIDKRLQDTYFTEGAKIWIDEKHIDNILSFDNEANVKAIRDLYPDWTIEVRLDNDTGRNDLIFG